MRDCGVIAGRHSLADLWGWLCGTLEVKNKTKPHKKNLL